MATESSEARDALKEGRIAVEAAFEQLLGQIAVAAPELESLVKALESSHLALFEIARHGLDHLDEIEGLVRKLDVVPPVT